MLAEPPHGDVNRRLMMVDTARSGPALRSGGFGTESGLAVRCAHCSRVWDRCVGVTGDADLARELIASAGQCWGLDLGDGHELSRFVNTTVLRPDLGVVVRIYRPGVGVERVAALQAARRALLDADLPVVPLVASSSGHTVEFVDGRAIEVEQYVDHDGSMNTTTGWSPGPDCWPGSSGLTRRTDGIRRILDCPLRRTADLLATDQRRIRSSDQAVACGPCLTHLAKTEPTKQSRSEGTSGAERFGGSRSSLLVCRKAFVLMKPVLVAAPPGTLPPPSHRRSSVPNLSTAAR